jgi:DNA mismatch repair protein MutS
MPSLLDRLSEAAFCSGVSVLARQICGVAETIKPCWELLQKALTDHLPARLADGQLIREGYCGELDELRLLRTDSRIFLGRLEAEEREATRITSLKAGYNSIFGYYFEVTKTHQAKVPARYTRKQTLTNAERYITPELKELENRILGAEEKILRLEAKLFEELRETALKFHDELLFLSEILSELDVYQALAEAAFKNDFVKPKVDLSYELDITEGRHPVLSVLLPSGSFIPNSLTLNARDPQIIVLTGPNMSGKSTYLRQNALIVLMAQIGSFVPARKAHIGIVDKILTRIGAQDTLTEGSSTFMVEMKETSQILRTAGPRSLLILDEVGRGTSTFDGISIAWAVLEHLQGAYAWAQAQGPRVLFATHYFELTELACLPGVANFNVEAREWKTPAGKTELVFLYKISPGPADRSYGIHVAALAGLPAGVLARAREILDTLESESASGRLAGPSRKAPELPLFKKPGAEDHPVLEALRLITLESMTPLEALSALTALKDKL